MEAKNRGLTPLLSERWGPLILALCGGVLFWLLQKQGMFLLAKGSKDAYLGALLSLGGVFTGFMATLKTLLFSMNSQIRKKLRDSGYERDLLRYVSEALWGSMFLCGIALVAFHLELVIWLSATIGAAVVFAITAIVRIATIATDLLSIQD